MVETRSMKKKREEQPFDFQKTSKVIDSLNKYLEECRIQREKDHGDKPRKYCKSCNRDITFTHCGYDTCNYCYETEFSVY